MCPPLYGDFAVGARAAAPVLTSHRWWKQCRSQPASAQHQRQRVLLQQAHTFNQTIMAHSCKLEASSEQSSCIASACTSNQRMVMPAYKCMSSIKQSSCTACCGCMTKASYWNPCKMLACLEDGQSTLVKGFCKTHQQLALNNTAILVTQRTVACRPWKPINTVLFVDMNHQLSLA